MINLISVYDIDQRHDILYQLLDERTIEQSISHKSMPTMTEHTQFVDSQPYLVWCFIQSGDVGIVGSVYITKDKEIGISIFKDYQRQGFARMAIRLIIAAQPGKLLANINPRNTASIELFKSFGAKHIQNTYEIDG